MTILITTKTILPYVYHVLEYSCCIPTIRSQCGLFFIDVQLEIDQFRYIKIQPKTINLSTRLRGTAAEFVGFIPRSLVLRSIVSG